MTNSCGNTSRNKAYDPEKAKMKRGDFLKALGLGALTAPLATPKFTKAPEQDLVEAPNESLTPAQIETRLAPVYSACSTDLPFDVYFP